MRALAASFALLIMWLAAGAASADPAHDFAAARADLAKHMDETGLPDGDPATPAVERRVWAAAEAVAAQSGGSEAQAKTALTALDKDMDIHLARLDASTLLMGLAIGGVGDVFIVERGKVAWRLGDTAGGGYLKPLLAWDLRAPAAECGADHPDTNTWYACLPLGPASLGRLPDTASGQHRFWIDADYAQAAGETDSGQISFWTWDGAHATPLLLRIFQFHIELDGAPTLAGDILNLPTKDDFQSFLSCGACAGRQRVWRFQLTASGVADLGEISKVPELDLIDQIYHRAAAHQPLTGLASPAAARIIAKLMADADTTSQWPMGALDDWTLSADHRRLCVAVDEGGAVEFTLTGLRAHPTVAAAKRLQTGQCGDVEHRLGATSGS